ncbi:MAG: 5-formyltetrahydrofolate cyclo-ligase [Pseudomonadales bacterium]|nr:5-formyltetrahydrofolate cyclo-ligase [Pseudomonadales bacterium]
MSSRTILRNQCRALRIQLSDAERRQASLLICRRIRASAYYWAADHIALFWPMDGTEVDLRELLGSVLRHGKRCYLPVMRSARKMAFVRYRATSELYLNDYGILEPRFPSRDALAPALLDLVCVPLLGFDRSGTRLGAGGGYYDRAFSFKIGEPAAKPRLLGVAYANQELRTIAREPWDVALGAVATERELIECAAGGSAQE